MIDYLADRPVLICLLAFVITFILTRIIVRSIRAGIGPFHDINTGGTHIHHAVPGIILMVIGGVGAIAARREADAHAVAALIFGIGLALVCDEFALILHLEDVYWSEEGRVSVDLVFVLTALLAVLVVAIGDVGQVHAAQSWIGNIDEERRHRVLDITRWAALTLVIINAALAVTAVLKGKVRMAVIGAVIPVIAIVGAWRLARPQSYWSHRFYQPEKKARAEIRATKHDAKWGRRYLRVQDFLSGGPSKKPPANHT
jgi:hypothetical protein